MALPIQTSYETLHPLTPKQRRFLKCFEACASVTQAARWAKISRETHYEWLRTSAVYIAAFAESQPRAARALEDEAVRRAHQGLRKTVRYKGRIVGYETEYSDTLMLALLKGNNPEKFRERWSGEVTGKDGKPLLDIAAVRALLQADDAN